MASRFQIKRKLVSLGLAPRTRLAWFATYIAGIGLALVVLRWAIRVAAGAKAAPALDGWVRFAVALVVFLLGLLALRWFRNHLLWRVRNRLIVTYLFIGGVPITLVVAMALIAGYLFIQHFSMYIAVSDIQAQIHHLEDANLATAREITRHEATPAQAKGADAVFPGRHLDVLTDTTRPAWLKGNFSGIVTDHNRFYLRVARNIQYEKETLTVVSSVPVDEKLVARLARRFGVLTFNLSGSDQDSSIFETGDQAPASNPALPLISAGSVAAPAGWLDIKIPPFFGKIQTTDWATGSAGDNEKVLLAMRTRISTIYNIVSGSLGDSTGDVGVLFLSVAITFGVVVLAALIVGIRLTRTITYSVANLYDATQHINRGDFTHHIKVRERDQLAALQLSFNSMTESLQRLIAEQKEKERLQSELEIAQQVQEQLFPKALSGTRTLELSGVCRPARIVSGDYYDFLTYGPEQIGIAVGDISGKGISAALLMATIHSAVRAYEEEQLAGSRDSLRHPRKTKSATADAPPSPAQMLWLLNRHLYRSTQPEKYATLFLGFYDGDTRSLNYSNAGHLPPLILGLDGSVRRLDVGGTVVGLFDNVEYEERTVKLHPGDIFVAYSDGITEPENEFGEFGEERLVETILQYRNQPLERIIEQTIAAIHDWIGSTEQPDDITLVLARSV